MQLRLRVFRHYVPFPLLLLAAAEACAFGAAVYLAAYLRFLRHLQPALAKYYGLWPSALTFSVSTLLCLLAMGLYSSRQRARMTGIVSRVTAGVVASILVCAIIFYLVPVLQTGRGVLVIAGALAFFGSVAIRAIFDHVVDEDIFKRRVLVFGAGRQAQNIANLRRRSDQRGFRIVGYVHAQDEHVLVPIEHAVVPPGSILQFAVEHEVDELVVAMDDRRRSFPVHEFLECRIAGIDVTDLVTFLERETGKVRLDVLNPAWIIFSEGFGRDPLQRAAERGFDVLTSLALFCVAAPIMLLTAFAIVIEDGPGVPILYRQTRVGLDGRSFQILKFRSMRPDSEQPGEAVWARKEDSRVTRVGAVIRKLRIDELPQILNVLRGDMRLVGPRPERPEFVAQLEERIPYYRERHCVKPGITGWAQLCYPYGASETDAAEKLQYDLYYVKNHTLLFDLLILLQTAEVVLWSKGAR